MKLLDAGEVQVGKVFSAEYDFTIPDYQRPYAWGKDETLQLLDDLEDALSVISPRIQRSVLTSTNSSKSPKSCGTASQLDPA
jgi:hypothetical protein